jgi:hypothetical protein
MFPRKPVVYLLLAGLISWQMDACLAAQSIKGWVLQQENPHTGVWNVYLSNAGMAAANKKLGCTLVTRAPQWNVVMYNDKTKVYFLSPLSEWKGASIKTSATGKGAGKQAAVYKSMLVEKKPKKLKEGKILGHKASQYLTDNLASTGLKKVEFWVTPDVQAPPELKQVFSKIYGVGLSSMSGLPLKVSYIDENGKRTPVFTTEKIESKNIPLSEFSYPASYKRVDSEIAVLMDEKGREAMASIMDDVGDAENGEDINALLDSSGSKHKSKSRASAGSEGGDALDPLGEGDSKTEKGEGGGDARAAQASNGDWGKGIMDWFSNTWMSFLRFIGLAKEETGSSESSSSTEP